MKKRVLLLAVVFVFLTGLTIQSDAGMRSKGKGMGMGPGKCDKCMGMQGKQPMIGAGMMGMIKELGLDDKQAAEFKSIHLKMKKERIQKGAEVRIAELELQELQSKDRVDMKAAEAKIRQIETLKSEMKISHIRTHESVKAMLTPEQRKKLDSFRGMGQGMGMRGNMKKNCGMMGNMQGSGQPQQMDEYNPQDQEDTEDSDMPDEGHVH